MKNVYSFLNDIKTDIDNVKFVNFDDTEKKRYQDRFIQNSNKEKKRIMNISKTKVVAASIAICAIIATTANADAIVKFVKENFKIKGVSIVQENEDILNLEKETLCNLLYGKVYNEEGRLYTIEDLRKADGNYTNSEVEKELLKQVKNDPTLKEKYDECSKNAIRLYDIDGKEIMWFRILDKNGNDVDLLNAYKVEFEYENIIKASLSNDNDIKWVYKTEDEAKEYASFGLLTPTYLPEGYTFDRAKFFYGEEECRDYVFIEYKNGENVISIHERKYSLDNEYETGARNPEKIMIQGKEAIFADDTVYVTLGDSICSVMGKNINREELIKVAESLSK